MEYLCLLNNKWEHREFFIRSNQTTTINKILGIGSVKLLQFLRNKSRRHIKAKILLNIYYLEKHKYDTRNFKTKRLKSKKIENALINLRSIEDNQINFSVYRRDFGFNEYIIDYNGYIFSYMLPEIDLLKKMNIPKNESITYKQEVYHYSKLFDLIYDEYGDTLEKMRKIQ
jgi:hypothetical protein